MNTAFSAGLCGWINIMFWCLGILTLPPLVPHCRLGVKVSSSSEQPEDQWTKQWGSKTTLCMFKEHPKSQNYLMWKVSHNQKTRQGSSWFVTSGRNSCHGWLAAGCCTKWINPIQKTNKTHKCICDFNAFRRKSPGCFDIVSKFMRTRNLILFSSLSPSTKCQDIPLLCMRKLSRWLYQLFWLSWKVGLTWLGWFLNMPEYLGNI